MAAFKSYLIFVNWIEALVFVTERDVKASLNYVELVIFLILWFFY